MSSVLSKERRKRRKRLQLKFIGGVKFVLGIDSKIPTVDALSYIKLVSSYAMIIIIELKQTLTIRENCLYGFTWSLSENKGPLKSILYIYPSSVKYLIKHWGFKIKYSEKAYQPLI